jgi:lysyl-tRNA synthetase class 2
VEVEGGEALRQGDVVEVLSEAPLRVAVRARASGWDHDGDGARWGKAAGARGQTRAQTLWARQRIVRAVREDLYAQGFLEVQAPLWLRSACPDLAIESARVEGGGWLTSSTEYALKRLAVGGFERAFTLTQNFRAGEVGPLHNPEFTMLEWYRAFATLEQIEDDVERFACAALCAVDPSADFIEIQGHRVQLRGVPWERLSVREALSRHLGVEVDEAFSLPSVLRGAAQAGVELPASAQHDAHAALSFLLAEVQPRLGLGRPTFLREWPACMTSSAPPLPDNPHVAQRSELFLGGVELADGFPFLTDAGLQARLFEQAQAERAAHGLEGVDLDGPFLEALRQGMPPGAGMALGLDRLVLALTGERELRRVLAFAWDER